MVSIESASEGCSQHSTKKRGICRAVSEWNAMIGSWREGLDAKNRGTRLQLLADFDVIFNSFSPLSPKERRYVFCAKPVDERRRGFSFDLSVREYTFHLHMVLAYSRELIAGSFDVSWQGTKLGVPGPLALQG